MKWDGDGPWVTPWLILTNVGHSVATDIRYAYRMFPRMGPVGISAAPRMTGHDATQALFPAESSRQLIPMAVSKELMEAAHIIIEGDDQLVELFMMGEVTYRYPTSESEHVTRFAYHIGRFDQPKARIVVKIGETVPPNDITFLREPLCSYAD